MFQKNGHARTGERLIQGSEKWLAYEEKEGSVQKEECLPGEAGLSLQDGEHRMVQEKKEPLSHDVEQRLSAYYGPALPAHPLPDVAWLSLRERLQMPEQSLYRRFQLSARLAPRLRQPLPLELQQMYATLLLQTNYRHPSPALRLRLRRRPVQPRVETAVLGRGRINLVLPREKWQALSKAELEMLLAAGLARCSGVSRPLYLLPRALFAMSLLFVLAALPFTSVDRRAVWIFLIAFACCMVSGSLLVWQQRLQAFRGDTIAVEWLGRERVCQALHLLAERGQPERRPTWGEPSLVERIARVCGTPITNKDKRLTLVG